MGVTKSQDATMKLLIIDGNAIMHRAYHAIPLLSSQSGQPTNAVYGFILMLTNLIRIFKPKYLLVAFDEAEKTFRKKQYVHYQSKRPAMDEWLVSQMSLVREWLDVAGVSYLSKGGYEADDVIGTICAKVHSAKNKTHGLETVIVTGDRDIFQLIKKSVKVYTPKGMSNGKLWGEEEVQSEFDFSPSQIIDYKALVGDSSDNYPGVPGIGPKTARELIVKYHTVENIYQHLQEIKPTLKAKLEKYKKDAFFFQKLATIFEKVPIAFQLEKCNKWNLQSPAVADFYQQYGFRTFLARIKVTKPELIKKATKAKQGKKVSQMTLI